jgi:hypothetical protein
MLKPASAGGPPPVSPGCHGAEGLCGGCPSAPACGDAAPEGVQ